MAIPERDTVYTNDGANRTVYTRESNGTGWFVGIIVALALLAIGYLVFSANSGPTVPADVNNTTTVESPVTDPAMSPMTAPADPMVEAPATETTAPVDAAPATEETAPAAPAEEAAPADAGAAAPVEEPVAQ